MPLHGLDVAIIALSLLGVFAIGAWAAWRRRSCDTADYFLSDRSLQWWAVGASLFASNIGAEHFVGQSGAAAKVGMVVAVYEWSACLFLAVLGFWCAAVYLRSQVVTVPQYIERRFDWRCRALFCAVTILVYTATKVAASLYAVHVFFRAVFGLNMYLTMTLVVCSTALYTVLGGLDAVVYTDCLQLLVFLCGGGAAALVTLHEIGGVSGIYSDVKEMNLEDGQYLKTWRSADAQQYSGIGLLLGLPVVSFWYWCVDQEMVQRALGAATIAHARAGAILAGFLKMSTPFLTVFPGIVARLFFEKCRRGDERYSDWCSTELDKEAESDAAYANLVLFLYPIGIRGLVVSTVLAAAMSSLAAVFNSASALITMDVYKQLRPEATESDCVWCGRLACVGMMGISLLWIPVIELQEGNMYFILQNIAGAVAPTLSVTAFFAIFTKRANSQGALTGMVVGLCLGVIRLVLNLVHRDQCRKVDTQWEGPTLACMDFNVFIFMVTVIIALFVLSVSKFFPPPTAEQLKDSRPVEESIGKEEAEGLLAEGNVTTADVKSDGDEIITETQKARDELPPKVKSETASWVDFMCCPDMESETMYRLHTVLAIVMVFSSCLLIVGFGSRWFGLLP